jgi:catechol 2,3-dioxygenase-like lactoylglutathione lyase family enzyme
MKLIYWATVALVLTLLPGCAQRINHERPPRVDHILLEVSDMKASIAFYRDLMGLQLKSDRGDFVTLEAENIGVFLWSKRWDWEAPRAKGERQGLGMYPHFQVADVKAVVERARQAGYKIVQEPKKYLWGTEAFISDPDGYIWAIID